MTASARDGDVIDEPACLLITDRGLRCWIGSLRAADKSRCKRAGNGKEHTTRCRLGSQTLTTGGRAATRAKGTKVL